MHLCFSFHKMTVFSAQKRREKDLRVIQSEEAFEIKPAGLPALFLSILESGEHFSASTDLSSMPETTIGSSSFTDGFLGM